MVCNLCGAQRLNLLYAPDGSRTEAKVYGCAVCGLLQTYPRLDRNHGDPANSYRADYGGLRVYKGLSAHRHVEQIRQLLTPSKILDVGANRGEFCRLANRAWPKAQITAIEPDGLLGWQTLPKTEYINARIEDVALKEYDLIYCAHTLEHLADPMAALKKLCKALIPTVGLMFLEVPNIGGIMLYGDILEELFIDRHLYHFSGKTLKRMVSKAGFRLLQSWASIESITYALSQSYPLTLPLFSDQAKHYLDKYVETRTRNLSKLPQAIAKIDRVAAVGAGRIFDAFVQHGLDRSKLTGVYDNLLATPVSELPPDSQRIIFSRTGFKTMEGTRFNELLKPD